MKCGLYSVSVLLKQQDKTECAVKECGKPCREECTTLCILPRYFSALTHHILSR